MEHFGLFRIDGVNERGRNVRATLASTTIAAVEAGGCVAGGEDEGPFFDLEFDMPAEVEERGHRERRRFSYDAGLANDERELQPTASFQRIDRRDRILYLPPSERLFLEGQLVVPIPPSSSSLPRPYQSSPASNTKPQVAAFIHKSAAKFRVFALGFRKKPKNASMDLNVKASSVHMAASTPKQGQRSKSSMRIKVEAAPVGSHLNRVNYSRSYGSSRSAMVYADDGFPGRGNKSFCKDVLQKYLSKIRPFYVKVSERYGENIWFSGPLTSGGTVKVLPATESAEFASGDKAALPTTASMASANTKEKSQLEGTIPAGLRVVCRRLKKSRSTSGSSTALSRFPSSASGSRDDSLMEQQDGIQSAIAHCKRSYNRGSESPLPR